MPTMRRGNPTPAESSWNQGRPFHRECSGIT